MRLQDLPRRWARRALTTARFCAESLGADPRHATLVVAYSTGLDSTVLLHLLHALAPSLDLTLIAAHVHHGLRPESDQEETVAQEVCANLALPLETCRLAVPIQAQGRGMGLEATARELRYGFLESVRRAHRADWIVTAHHGDDLAEDIVMRLARGAGWPGLGGMAGIDPKRHLLRPMLDWEKSELRAFAQDTGLTWCEDASNASQDQTRNRVRQRVMPLLRAENPAFAKACGQLWRMSRVDADFWQSQMPVIADATDEFLLAAPLLESAHPALRLRLYKHVLDHMGPGQALAAQLLLLDTAWQAKARNRCIQFPGDKIGTVRRDGIFFAHRVRPPHGP